MGDIQSLTGLDRNAPAIGMLIGDDFRVPGSGAAFAHISPVDGRHQADIALGGVQEVDDAVAAAKAAYPAWRATSGADRRRLLSRLADLIDENAIEFGRRAAIDGGTPVSIGATFSPQIASDWIRYYAGWADKIEGQLIGTYPSDDFAYIAPEPYGVIGVIITWNGPLVSLAMKVPAALAAGNTVVIKPSEMAPFCPEFFARLVIEAGFPAGVVNMVTGGIDAGERLIVHPDIAKVSFTGGPVTAKRIMHACADLLKPVVMELGGKAANLVFDDVDIDAVARSAVFSSIGVLSGQGCAIPSRVIVHDAIYDRMIEALVGVVEAMTLGDPFDPATNIGPLVNEAAATRVAGLIETAKSGGVARLVVGGARAGGDFARGAFVEPTIFADVPANDPLAQNEIFGPVLTVHRFRTEEEGIAIANSTPYGLGGYLHTHDLERAHRVAAAMVTGNVWVNGARTLAAQMPFGGMGISGFGREGGRAGLDEFLRHKAVGIAR